MSRENPTWGAPRILSELLLLGYDVAEGTVAKYMVRNRSETVREPTNATDELWRVAAALLAEVVRNEPRPFRLLGWASAGSTVLS
jgi:hypothetical protein